MADSHVISALSKKRGELIGSIRHYKKSLNFDNDYELKNFRKSIISALGTLEKEDLKYNVATGKSVGIDFGLKTFLTLSDKTEIESPL